MNHFVLRITVFALLTIFSLGACKEQTYTFRCSCNKIAYTSSGSVIIDESFNQMICDTTENIEAAFTGELSTIAQECDQYFDLPNGTEVASTDCYCECDLLGDCN